MSSEADNERWRTVTYCVVSRDLAPRLHAPLRRHFQDDPSIEVIVESRTRERRRTGDRRATESARAADAERRLIRARDGRRVDDRRAIAVPVGPPPLPRRARGEAARLEFFERLEPSTQESEDVDTDRVVTRFQAGDPDAFGVLYSRYFDRVYGYLNIATRDSHSAEDLTQQVFAKVFTALERYELRGNPFRAWLFTIVRRLAIGQLRREDRLEVMDPADPRLSAEDEPQPDMLAWISDSELMLFVERLPLSQRQVIFMRYMLGLDTAQIAEALERSEANVRTLHSRGLRYLRERLSAVRAAPKARNRRPAMRRRTQQAGVLRERRFALASPWSGRPLPRGR